MLNLMTSSDKTVNTFLTYLFFPFSSIENILLQVLCLCLCQQNIYPLFIFNYFYGSRGLIKKSETVIFFTRAGQLLPILQSKFNLNCSKD